MLKSPPKLKHCRLLTKVGYKFWNAWEQGSHGATAPENPVELTNQQYTPIPHSRSNKKARAVKKPTAQKWTLAFKTNCAYKGEVIHHEPCSCGGNSKVAIHECFNPDIKRCVPLKSNLQKIRDKTLLSVLTCCQSCDRYRANMAFVKVEQFSRDILNLIPKIPADITSIIGVARSGVYPASMLAMMLHLPLFILRQSKNDLIPAGCGWRLHDHKEKSGVSLVVDDTVMTGRSLSLASQILNDQNINYTSAAIYVNPAAIQKPAIWSRNLAWPHLLEWNLFNSVMSSAIAVDFDGILCHDCLPAQDDDGDKYIDFLNNALPKYLPKKIKVPLIVTARIEKYRPQTEAWLKKWGIKFTKLIMHPAPSLQSRNRDDIAKYKARHYAAWIRQNTFRISPPLFIESDDQQAQKIAEYAKHAVICPATGKTY